MRIHPGFSPGLRVPQLTLDVYIVLYGLVSYPLPADRFKCARHMVAGYKLVVDGTPGYEDLKTGALQDSHCSA